MSKHHVVIRIQHGYVPLAYGPFETSREADELHKALTAEMMERYEPWDNYKPQYFPMPILKPPVPNHRR